MAGEKLLAVLRGQVALRFDPDKGMLVLEEVNV